MSPGFLFWLPHSSGLPRHLKFANSQAVSLAFRLAFLAAVLLQFGVVSVDLVAMDYVILFIVIVILLAMYAASVRISRRAHITNYAFPEGLRSKFREARPDLTPGQENQVFEGLRQWFMVCNRADNRSAPGGNKRWAGHGRLVHRERRSIRLRRPATGCRPARH